MFGFGGLSEVFFILFLAMLIFGPEKLPEIGRMLAKGMAEVRKASNELKRTLNAELAISEQEQAARRNLQVVPPPAAVADPEPLHTSDSADPAPPAPAMWPVASAIPDIEPFPAATPATPAPESAAAAEQPTAPPLTDAGPAAQPPAPPLTDAGPASQPPAQPIDRPEVGGPQAAAAPAPAGPAAAAASSPLLEPYGQGREEPDARDQP
jgi:Sec-independent protein translocase protein TatA